MKKQIEIEDLDTISRSDLQKIIQNALEEIKNRHLLYKHTGQNYTQARLAEEIKIGRQEEISRARNNTDTISIERMRNLLSAIAKRFTELKFYTDLSVSADIDDAEVPLRDLADKLSFNLIHISTKLDEPANLEKMLTPETITRTGVTKVYPQRERFIAVVGAGASYAATINSAKPIPLAKDALEEFKNAFNRKVQKSFIDEEVARLANLRQTSIDDFETQLMAYSKFNNRLVIETLEKMCGNRYLPTLPYEILAHFFKHRFIDVILNFNYDELLDNAIEEEIPNSKDFSYVFAPGQCPKSIDDITIDKRLKQPIYIKCHGTISHPSSLRFQNDRAFIIEQAIQEHIGDLLMATAPPEEAGTGDEDYMPVNLLIIGFSLRNYVFNNLIEKAAKDNPKGIKLWIFDTDIQTFYNAERLLDKLDPEVKKRSSAYYIPLSTNQPLEVRLKDLWEKTSGMFVNTYQPRGIDRHLLVSQLFQDISPSENSNELLLKYYQDRLLIEIAILILLSDGMIHLSQIPLSRVGKYLSLTQRVQQRINPDITPNSIHDYLKKLALDIYENFMYDTYLHANPDRYKESISALSQHLYQTLLPILKTPTVLQKLNDLNQKGDLKKCFEGVRQRRLLMINPKYDHPHENLFAYLPPENIFNTSLGWIYNYRKNIDSNLINWDLMLAISEEGRFLREDFERLTQKGKYFELVLATTGIPEQPENAPKWFKNTKHLLSEKLRYRPWWMHNKHLVLLLRRKRDANGNITPSAKNVLDNWHFEEGYFYRQNFLSRRVNPIKLEKEEDLIKLLYIFAIYWAGSSPQRILNELEKVDMVTNRQSLNKIINNLLNAYEEKVL